MPPFAEAQDERGTKGLRYKRLKTKGRAIGQCVYARAARVAAIVHEILTSRKGRTRVSDRKVLPVSDEKYNDSFESDGKRNNRAASRVAAVSLTTCTSRRWPLVVDV